MSYWQYYQPNPNHDKVVGDCTIRAMTKALDMYFGRLGIYEEQP